MKICHMTSVHPHDDIRITVKEAQSLAEAGFEVHLIAANTNVDTFKNVHIHGLPNNYKGRIKRMLYFANDIFSKALEINADVYHFHDPELIPVGIKLKKERKKVIYDIHEDVPRQILNKYWIPKPLRKFISVIFEKYENKATGKFDAIVTATPHIKERFLKYNNNVININNFPILNELYTGERVYEKENSVIYIGGITEERGSVSMVNAIENTTGYLEIAGKFINDIETHKVENLPAWEEKVNFNGYLNRSEIKDLLSRVKAGLVLLEPRQNFIDSLPIKMFEYMAAGIPVISSNFPLWKEIIEGNNCGICVDPLNTNEISKTIQWIFDNPEKAKIMGENGRTAIMGKYNWEEESKKLVHLYNKLY